MTQEEHDKIFKMGQDATTEIWKQFANGFEEDPVLKKTAYEAMNLAWTMFKQRIDIIDSEMFWRNPVLHLGVFEVIRRQCVAYSEIYEQLWKEIYKKKYGREVALPEKPSTGSTEPF